MYVPTLALHPESDCSEFTVANGNVVITQIGVGGVANVSCDPCYTLSAKGGLQCQEGGVWNRHIPMCKRKYLVVVSHN